MSSLETKYQTVEIPIQGMDCADCTRHVQQAIASLSGVAGVEVLLAAEKAIVTLDPNLVSLPKIRQAVERAGYRVPPNLPNSSTQRFNRRLGSLFGVVFIVVFLIVLVGEGLGLFDRLNDLIPAPLGVSMVVLAGLPVFRNVLNAALQRQITSHSLMTLGAIAALIVQEWIAAAIVVLFMYVGSFIESFTAQQARQAIKALVNLAPRTARIERGAEEIEVPISEVQTNDIVLVKPGERIPVDGIVLSGQAAIDQSTITGEPIPLEAFEGCSVHAATLVKSGSLRILTQRVGKDTTFGRIIQLVAESEANRGEVQRFADRFSRYYLPILIGIAALTFGFSRNLLAATAVLVVACSCSIALATPIAMLATIGVSAKRGILIKGGKYIETLARANVLLVDKTGTLTLGKPHLTDIVPVDGTPPERLLAYAAAVERYSEHPLAEAVLEAARLKGIAIPEVQKFESFPGLGVRARVNGHQIEIGNRRFIPASQNLALATELEQEGKTILFLAIDGKPCGILAASDKLRPEVAEALQELRHLGIDHIELLTGDNDRAARALASQLNIPFRANLLPEEKIEIVKSFQARQKRVIMIGDGVNDAPALAQADIGIAMAAAGSDVAIEAAHIALLKENWRLVPELLRLSHRTMKVVRMNLAFTALYNIIGIALAAAGILPPSLAAAAQSLPDLGILANSARLLRADGSSLGPTP